MAEQNTNETDTKTIVKEFSEEVKEIDRKSLIDRLTRPDATFLNPFEVLQVDPDLPMNEIRTKYRRLSLLAHPDKNPSDTKRAAASINVLTTAIATLESEEGYKRCKKNLAEGKNKADGTAETDTKTIIKEFYDEVKEIDRKAVIDRLTRPGATYFNLNPFEVLQVDPDLPMHEIRKKYKLLALLAHPDKNPSDTTRAATSIDALKKAITTLESEEEYKRCKEILAEGKNKADEIIKAKRKQLKKERKPIDIPEDDPDKYKHAVYVQTCKLFADLERLTKQMIARESNEKKRKALEEIEELEKKKAKAEWDKKYEESRDDRVEGWRGWNKATKTARGGFKPPKPKMEKR